MKRSLAPAVLSTILLCSGAARAADYALVMPTGAVIPCSDIAKIRFKDMTRLYGMNNFSKEYEQYVRFHTFAPRDCRNAAARVTSLAESTPTPWRLVAQHVDALPAR